MKRKGVTAYASSLGRYLANRSARHANDASAHEDLLWDGQGLPAGLTLRWLGTSGFAISAEGTTLVIDPYVSRAPTGDIVRRRALMSDTALRRQHLPDCDAVLIGHTHFDHVVDAPALCAEKGARAYGSASLKHLFRLYGIEDHAVHVDVFVPYEIGPFVVTFVPSVHSKLLLGRAIPSDHSICCEHLDGLTSSAYGCGQVYGIHIQYGDYSMYHQGSADLLDDEIRHSDIDLFMMGIAGRGFTPRYAARILGRLQPKRVLAHHFDDFFKPLDAGLDFSLNVNLNGWIDEVREVSDEFSLHTVAPLSVIKG